jgi:PRC-barrel domain protein
MLQRVFRPGLADSKGATMATTAAEQNQRETHDLIGSDKVEGTNVYRSNGEKVGSIERVMLEKRSGKVAYAVMGFGGFLGLGDDHYPVPWERLTYNENLGGYEVNISDAELKGAPKYGNTEWDWNRDQGRKVYDYYSARPYWDE